jgi:hypothetical protein
MYSPFFETQSKVVAEIHDHARAAVFFKSRHSIYDAIGAYLRGIVIQHLHTGLDAGLNEQRFGIEVALAHLAQHRIERRHDGRDHDAVDVGNFDILHREKIAEDNTILVHGAVEVRADAPVRGQALVALRFRRDVLARAVLHSRKHAQHRIGVSHIND